MCVLNIVSSRSALLIYSLPFCRESDFHPEPKWILSFCQSYQIILQLNGITLNNHASYCFLTVDLLSTSITNENYQCYFLVCSVNEII